MIQAGEIQTGPHVLELDAPEISPEKTDLIGLRPRADNIVEIHPLIPAGKWDWFGLDGVAYHGHLLTILFDKVGTKYGKGKGLRILADGKQIGMSETLARLTAELPPG